MLPVKMLLFLLFIALTAFFNFAEMALVAARKPKLDALLARHSTAATLVVRLKDDPGRFLSAVQAGITVTSILAGTFCVSAFATEGTALLRTTSLTSGYAEPLGATLAVLIAAYLTLVLGELAPKRIALAAPELTATLVAHPLNWTIAMAKPFVLLLGWSNDALLKLLRVPTRQDDETSGDEIRSVISSALRSG